MIEDVRTHIDGQPIDLLAFIRRERERLVIKPNDEYGGSGVLLGWETGAAQWDAAIDSALADQANAWIVQERIHVRREPFPTVTSNRIASRCATCSSISRRISSAAGRSGISPA